MRFSLLALVAACISLTVAQPVLMERNGSASVKDIQCWYVLSPNRMICDESLLTTPLFNSQQLLSKNEASKAFGGILAIPDVVGNLGLGCTVSSGPDGYWCTALDAIQLQPIGVSLGSQCKSTPVICSEV